MKKLFILLLLIALPACALMPRHIEPFTWPSRIMGIEGEGDLDISWRKENYSGSFALKMDYPDNLIFEIYGPFGQTLVYVKKLPGEFLVIAGNEKSSDESFLKERYGLDARNLIDDLAMRGQRKELQEGVLIEREGYRVEYGQDRRGRRVISWRSEDGIIHLTFTDVRFIE